MNLLFSFLLLLLPFLFVFPAPTISYSDEYCDSYNTPTGTYTANSTYQSNLNALFSALKANATGAGDGFAAGNAGSIPDRVFGIVLCRGDINASSCSSCLSQIFTDIVKTCEFHKTSTMWHDLCYVQFSNQDFLSQLDNLPPTAPTSTQNVTGNQTLFFQDVTQLMSKMTSWALNSSAKFFATGIATHFSTQIPSIYGLLQCTTNMLKSQCQSCLQKLIDQLTATSDGKDGAWSAGIYCNVRYDTTPFYDGVAMVKVDAAPPSPSPNGTLPSGVTNGHKKSTDTVIAIAISLVTAAVLSLLIFFICLYKKRLARRRKYWSDIIDSEQNNENIDSFLISLSTLKSATSDFDESNKLGEGGFGAVYKGTLPNGQVVAVKRLSQSSSQGMLELKNELVLVAKLKHKNLVRVVGVCLEAQEKLLVYEFLPNRSLDTILFDRERVQELDWIARQAIIDGIARGLQYLHEDSQLKIILRDLKASNILLDSDMIPKISDFGLARLFPVDQTVHVTRRVVGTFGYMAPEYAMHGRYSIKSDVFSFGVLLLEIITGKRSSGSFDAEGSEDLLGCTWENWTSGTIDNIIDPSIDWPTNEIIQYIHIALLCVQEDPKGRPRMSEVVIMLGSDTVSLQAPSKPAFYLRRGGGGGSQKFVPAVSQNEITISEFEPR